MLDTTTITGCLTAPLQVAHSQHEIIRACHFRKQEYQKTYPSVTVQENDPFHDKAYVLYSCDHQGNINSTASLVLDSDLGLPEDKLFPEKVNQYRRQGKKLMEIGRFVIEDGQNLLKAYYRSVYEVAVHQGIDIILMVIRQKDIPFHRKIIGANTLIEDIGENFGSQHTFSCMEWEVNKTYQRFIEWSSKR